MIKNTLSKTGILVTNLGTPEAPTPQAVKTYLSEFLSDPFVLQIPKFFRWLIQSNFILTPRSQKSALLYQKIWTEAGSPLRIYTESLALRLRSQLHDRGFPIQLSVGMRYGKPSLLEALQELKNKNIEELILFPLYPQFSTTTTASTFNEVTKQLALIDWHPAVRFIDHYAIEEVYVNAIAKSIDSHWQKTTAGEILLFSFHGLPEKIIEKGDPYHDLCQQTAQKVAAKLNLSKDKWRVVFQSRFGRQKWLKPYCSETLASLPQTGIKHIDIICPGFAVDCLETLEEIAIANKKIFINAGGLSYNYIPALNDTELHSNVLFTILLQEFI